MPKRALSAYVFFMKDKMQELKKDKPTEKTTELMRAY